jgi:hypothetical protein
VRLSGIVVVKTQIFKNIENPVKETGSYYCRGTFEFWEREDSKI